MSDAAAQSVALAHVAVVLDDLDVQRYDSFGFAGRLIGIAVRNDDHLIRPTERIELLSKSRVYGTLAAPLLKVEEGAFFQGTCQMAEKPKVVELKEKTGI